MPETGVYAVNFTNTLMSDANLFLFTWQPTPRPAFPSVTDRRIIASNPLNIRSPRRNKHRPDPPRQHPSTLHPETGVIDQSCDLAEAIRPANPCFDGTCLKTNIHFPTDWILLRDAVRTLMKGTLLIRRPARAAACRRPPHPSCAPINRCFIAMSQSHPRQNSKHHRKAILREIEAAGQNRRRGLRHPQCRQRQSPRRP